MRNRSRHRPSWFLYSRSSFEIFFYCRPITETGSSVSSRPLSLFLGKWLDWSISWSTSSLCRSSRRLLFRRRTFRSHWCLHMRQFQTLSQFLGRRDNVRSLLGSICLISLRYRVVRHLGKSIVHELGKFLRKSLSHLISSPFRTHLSRNLSKWLQEPSLFLDSHPGLRLERIRFWSWRWSPR